MDLCNIFRDELLVLFKEEQYVDEFRFITHGRLTNNLLLEDVMPESQEWS